jgi:hypothetical protein
MPCSPPPPHPAAAPPRRACFGALSDQEYTKQLTCMSSSWWWWWWSSSLARRSTGAEERLINLREHGHNFLRISRILQCLRETGMAQFQRPVSQPGHARDTGAGGDHGAGNIRKRR